MKWKRFLTGFIFVILIFCFLSLSGVLPFLPRTEWMEQQANQAKESFIETALGIFNMEPDEVRALRKAELVLSDEGHQEYYFNLLQEEEQRVYRELLSGIRARKEKFYLSSSEDYIVNHAYSAVLKDHPELYWVHNRERVYKTTYSGQKYCMFSPGYTYTPQEMAEIDTAMEEAFQEVQERTAWLSDDYEVVKEVYTYLIDATDYGSSDHDQNIAGVFWKRNAVCAGYAAAMQYLLERLGIPCIYVEGDAKDSDTGHAWNIVELGGQYYYVDATNGDQPEFLTGDAVQLAEHKTTLYDYLCPYPEEYEETYTPSSEFELPACTAHDLNFYVLNGACFDVYDWDSVYELCKLRIDSNAAVIRFKFGSREAFEAAAPEWVDGEAPQTVAKYYMEKNWLEHVEYHCGVLESLHTVYYIF